MMVNSVTAGEGQREDASRLSIELDDKLASLLMLQTHYMYLLQTLSLGACQYLVLGKRAPH